MNKKTVEIAVLAQSSRSKVPAAQQALALEIEKDTDVEGIGMGVLSDGTPYLNQRGLAKICGVMNAHIGTISSQWSEKDQKPRILSIKAILEKTSAVREEAHIEIKHKGVVHFCYPSDVCLAILEYYAFDAGQFEQQQARENFRQLAGSKLRELIYSQVGYDPTRRNSKRFDKWHERIALNYQSAPKGFFCVFNEANPIFYELIQAGAQIDEKFVVDISIGYYWSSHWSDHSLDTEFGARAKFNHRYPDDHPQSKSNPQESWCYPLSSLGYYRQWLQEKYIEGGKFSTYLHGKVKNGGLAPSVAQLAIATIVTKQLESSAL